MPGRWVLAASGGVDPLALAAVIISAVAAAATLAAVWFARDSARSGRAAAQSGQASAAAGEQAAEYGRQAVAEAAKVAALNAQALQATTALLREAEAERLAAERDRHRQRLLRVGELAEEMFWAGHQARQADWMQARNRLRSALFGLHSELGGGYGAVNAASDATAMSAGRQLVLDVEGALQRLDDNA